MGTSGVRRAVVIAALVVPAVACAVPFVPASDDEVVATLPQRPGAGAGEARQARDLRERLRRDPQDARLAVTLAQQAIAQARRDGDPRRLGEAQAALAPWWSSADPPPAVRLLRATVRQSQHDFDAARADLDALVGQGRGLAPALAAQAHLSRAAVLQVQGRFAEARADCVALQRGLGETAAFHGRVCEAELASLRGAERDAAEALAREAAQAPAGSAAWVALVRAEAAERRGDPAAGALYRAAVAGAPEVYALAAKADWLLRAGRPREVIELLRTREDADALLLRLAIAYRQAGDPRAAATRDALRARLDAARLRGDTTHAREAARFALDLDDDAATALALAQAQWASQKEPADALLLVRAARAAGQPQAAEPVRRFMRETGFRDQRLRAEGLT
jgi:tetratricopeptide (TPR) repeat protein